MVSVVSSIPSGGNFIFADFETPRCQFCTKLPEMSDLCYLGKTRLMPSLFVSKQLQGVVKFKGYDIPVKNVRHIIMIDFFLSCLMFTICNGCEIC